MNVLFVSRKRKSHIGGLARFANELTTRLPQKVYRLDLDSWGLIFKLPLLKINHIHLSDATLLPLGVILKGILACPLSLTAHGLDLTYANKVYQRVIKALLPKADCLVLDSQEAKSLLKKFALPAEKVKVVPPGITLDHLKKTSQRKLPNFQGKLVLLTVGNLVARKGQLWFIEKVLTGLPDNYVYLLVGDGGHKDRIRDSANRLGLADRVYLLGRLSNSKLAYLLKKVAQVYISPNQKIPGDFEGFGLAAGEAATIGLPVVSTGLDGTTEVIKPNKNGLVLGVNPKTWIRLLGKLKDKQYRSRLGNKAKFYTLKNYSWDKAIKAYEAIFAELSDKKPESVEHTFPS